MALFGRRKEVGQLVDEALALLEAGKTEQAAARLTEATRADPTHAQAWYCLGTIHSGAGRLVEAVDCYRRSAEHAPFDKKVLPLFNMGNALQNLGMVDEALDVFTLVTKVAPGYSDAWINRGRLLDDAGQHAEAIECYDTALALEPDEVMALANRGNSLRALERFTEARASYEAALVRDPHDPASLVGLGYCLSRLGQPEQGLRLMDRVVARERHPAALAERAIVLSVLDRHDEALASIDEAIALGADDVVLHHNRAEILAKAGRFDEAIASFDDALKRNARYTPSLFGKARAFCNIARYEQAKAAIDQYFQYTDGTDGLEDTARAIVLLCQQAGVH